jgi:hypothetical protein
MWNHGGCFPVSASRVVGGGAKIHRQQKSLTLFIYSFYDDQPRFVLIFYAQAGLKFSQRKKLWKINTTTAFFCAKVSLRTI